MLKGVTKHHVLSSFQLEVLLHVLSYWRQDAISMLTHRGHDQMRVVTAEVMYEHWNVIHHTAIQITTVVRGSAKPASHVVMVSYFAVLIAIVKRTVLSFTD